MFKFNHSTIYKPFADKPDKSESFEFYPAILFASFLWLFLFSWFFGIVSLKIFLFRRLRFSFFFQGAAAWTFINTKSGYQK